MPILDIMLWGYAPFLVVCLFSAIWFRYFSRDMKAPLGSFFALIAAFIPLVNIWWTVMAIRDTPMEIRNYVHYKKGMKNLQRMLNEVK